MKIISDPSIPVNFNATSRKKFISSAKKLTAAAASGIGLYTINNKTGKTTELDVNMRETLIKSKIQENIEKKKTISVKSIAKELNIPIHLVITSLYRTKSNIRTLFDKVKNTSYLRKPTSYNNQKAAQEIVNASKSFLTTDSNTKFENVYASSLGRKLDILEISPNETEELKNLYEVKPALADAILFSRSKARKAGSISPNTMKAIVAAHEINQELTEELLFEKYALRDVYKIVKVNQMSKKLLEPAKENATLVYELATVRMKNNKPRFGADDILQVIKSMKKEPEYTQLIMQQKNGLEDYRFNGHQIRLILSTYEKFPSIVNNLINACYNNSSTQAYKYSSFCIEKILETLNGDDIDKIRMVKRILDSNQKNSSSIILEEIEKYEAKYE